MSTHTGQEIYPYVKFMFEIDNPSLEDCYRYGYESATEGLAEQDNPFVQHGAQTESEYWLQGWWDGFYGAQPVFELNLAPKVAATSMFNKEEGLSELAANEGVFEEQKDSKVTTVAKLAAAVAGAFLSYQIIDLIA